MQRYVYDRVQKRKLPSTEGDPIAFYHMFSETQMYIPRAYSKTILNVPWKMLLSDGVRRHIPCCVVTPRNEMQKDVIRICEEKFKEDEVTEGILQVYTGGGKTFLTIYLICNVLKVRALIIVNNFSELGPQWKERFEQYCPGIQIGFLQGKRNDSMDMKYDAVIASIDSLCLHEYEGMDTFGLTVVDECHHIGAAVITKSLWQCQSKRMLGLSATPDRRDETHEAIQFFLGSIWVQKDVTRESVHVVPVVFRSYALESKKVPLIGGSSKIVNRAKVINYVHEDEERSGVLRYLIGKWFTMPNTRRMLVLVDRLEYLKSLVQWFQGEFPDETCGGLYGGLKKMDLEKVLNCRVIIALYVKGKEALDIPDLNVLILGSPYNNLRQVAGRIRLPSLEDQSETHPVIVDLVDVYSSLKGSTMSRYHFYRDKKYNLHWNQMTWRMLNMDIYPDTRWEDVLETNDLSGYQKDWKWEVNGISLLNKKQEESTTECPFDTI